MCNCNSEDREVFQSRIHRIAEDFNTLTNRRMLLETENQDFRDLIEIVGELIEALRG
jgi:hypothetical protein